MPIINGMTSDNNSFVTLERIINMDRSKLNQENENIESNPFETMVSDFT